MLRAKLGVIQIKAGDSSSPTIQSCCTPRSSPQPPRHSPHYFLARWTAAKLISEPRLNHLRCTLCCIPPSSALLLELRPLLPGSFSCLAGNDGWFLARHTCPQRRKRSTSQSARMTKIVARGFLEGRAESPQLSGH